MTVLRARGNELTRDYVFGCARSLFESTLHRVDDATRARLQQGPAALAEPALGQGAAFEPFGVVHGLYWLTVNLADERPLAILVDDVHWADELSLRYFAYIAERLDDVPVALVIAIRTGDPGAESPLVDHLWTAASASPIRPAELSEAAVAELLREGLPDHEVDDGLVRSVSRETGGNPFLVNAVATAIRTGQDTSVGTPESVRRHIARRLARFDSAARDLAKAASILGGDVALRSVVRLAGLHPERGIAAAEQLVAGQIFAATDPVAFVHPMVRTAIYSGLVPGERPAGHARAAKLLAADQAPPEMVAEHLMQAAPTDEAWALSVLHDAGRAAARKGAPAAAARYLRRAVDGADIESLSPTILVDLGLAEAASGESTSLDRFEQALSLVEEPTERSTALYSLGQTLYRYGRHADAAAAFRRGMQLAEAGDRQDALRFEAAAWTAEYYLSPAHRGAPMSLPEGNGPGDRAVLAVQAMHASLTTPPASVGADLATRALGDGALLAEQTSQGLSANFATLALLHGGLLAEAHEAADAVVRDARERGALLAYSEASLIRALVLYTRGRITDAAADAQAAVDGMRHGWHALAPTALGTLVHCMIERGELKEAADLIERAEAELAPPEASGVNAWIFVARGRVRLRCRQFDDARADLEAAEEALRYYGTINPAMLPWRSLAGLIVHATGDEERGRALIEEEIELSRQFEVPIPLGVALRRRALIETGDQAQQTLLEAMATLESTGADLELARAYGEHGRVLRRAGKRVAARDQLALALDLAHRCGATGLETEVREELVAAGARPRRNAVSGVESLTPTEQRVAQLAVEGLSNREIAELTFVSQNTIAWHLRNVYRKLDVDSRDQLRERMSATF